MLEPDVGSARKAGSAIIANLALSIPIDEIEKAPVSAADSER